MDKIPSLFKRDFAGTHKIYDEMTGGCEWVMEAVATRKRDGTACLGIDGSFYKRFDAKNGRVIPKGAIPCSDAPDENTGHFPHWVPVLDQDKYHWEGLENSFGMDEIPDRSFELCGPKVNGNKEGFDRHVLLQHGAEIIQDAPTGYKELEAFFSINKIEGIVWHHHDGRMCKIKRKDFGFSW